MTSPSPPLRPRATSFRSLPEMWNHRVGSTPELTAMWQRRGGDWIPFTWREADQRVQAIGNGLLSLGLQAEDRAAILAETAVDWIVADLGILAAGGATSTVHTGSPDDDVHHVLSDCGARVVFCGTREHVEQIQRLRPRLPALEQVVVFAETAGSEGVLTLAQLELRGRDHAAAHPDALRTRTDAIAPDHLATLIYTSGTTGKPKGVELTHDAWVYEAEAIDRLGVIGPADKQLLFLPLAHVFAKVMQVAFIRLGVPTAIDGSFDRLMQNLVEVRPTWLAAVPRVFEKAFNRIVLDAQDRGYFAERTFHWALGVGRRVSQVRQAGRSPSGRLAVEHALAHRLVFRHIHAAFGGQLRFLISGAAPLPRDVAEFFHACGLLICEGYGLTESAAASCVNTPQDFVFGTVGKPLSGCEIRIADDGEILLRSRGVMRGYHNLPELTAETLTDDGWLRTGDLGQQLSGGHLQITGRKKELIVTATGKNVAPAWFQDRIRARTPMVAHALVHGDSRNYCSALIALDGEEAARWARSEGLSVSGYGPLAGHPAVVDAIRQAVDDVNRELPGFAQVRRFHLVPRPFTVDDGTLTPTGKLKREVIEARYRETLEGFYQGTRARLRA